MEKLNEILNKYLIYAIYGVFFFVFLNTCSTKSRNKENVKMRTEIDSLSTRIDILQHNIYSKEEADIRTEIQGLKISKRTLYDWNYIVRTSNRPDDKMNEYDQKIEEKTKELEALGKK